MKPCLTRCRFGVFFLVILVCGLGAAACGGTTPTSLPTATGRSPITPYYSPTPSQAVNSQARIQNTSTPPPPPTPTPVTYKVVKGDTMLGIALRYGVSLEDLLAANPEVDPRFLSIDTVLTIPQGEQTTGALVTPTPPAVDLQDPVCYKTSDGGAWCFLLVVNDRPYALENISAWIGLYNANGENVAGEEGITPLNLLPAGEAMPIVVHFSPPVPEDFTVSSDRFSAFESSDNADRYLETRLAIGQVEIGEDGLGATVRGTVSLPENSPPANLVWVLAIAYDEQGNVVGVRRWGVEGSEEELSPALAGEDSLPFTLEVYTTGPAIDRVEVLVEARP